MIAKPSVLYNRLSPLIGEPIGKPGDTPEEALEYEGWQVVQQADGPEGIAMGVTGHRVALVRIDADWGGPWAVFLATDHWLPNQKGELSNEWHSLFRGEVEG